MTVAYGMPAVMLGAPPVTTTCSPPSGSIFNIGANTVTCTATDALGRTDSCTFGVTVAPPPLLAVTRFIAFGDSITWGEDGFTPTALSWSPSGRVRPYVQVPQPYPTVLLRELTSRYTVQTPAVENQGCPGEEITGPQPFPRFTRLLATGRYDAVLIMEGANDLYVTRDSRIEPRIIAVLRQMIQDARSRGIRPLLATIPPEHDGCCPDRGISWREVPDLNNLIRTLATEEGVPLVDVYQALIDHTDDEIGPDGLHPTQEGYMRIAQSFFETVKQTLEQQRPTVPTRLGTGRRILPPRTSTPPTTRSPSGSRGRSSK
jgi:hypothetical protein